MALTYQRQQVVVNFPHVCQGMPCCLTLSLYTMTANCALEEKSAVYN